MIDGNILELKLEWINETKKKPGSTKNEMKEQPAIGNTLQEKIAKIYQNYVFKYKIKICLEMGEKKCGKEWNFEPNRSWKEMKLIY